MKTILLFSALQANATAPPAALPVVAREEVIVVTATRAETPVSKVGSSVTVIDDKEIERSQENFVSELLAQVPGVSFSRNGGVGTLLRPSAKSGRGFSHQVTIARALCRS